MRYAVTSIGLGGVPPSIIAVHPAILSSDDTAGAKHFRGLPSAPASEADQRLSAAIPATTGHFLVVIDCPQHTSPTRVPGQKVRATTYRCYLRFTARAAETEEIETDERPRRRADRDLTADAEVAYRAVSESLRRAAPPRTPPKRSGSVNEIKTDPLDCGRSRSPDNNDSAVRNQSDRWVVVSKDDKARCL